jgi:hypothetical protein
MGNGNIVAHANYGMAMTVERSLWNGRDYGMAMTTDCAHASVRRHD